MLKNILLGFLQGITEFLPISSSGHLIFLSWFLFKDRISVSHVVFLHGGTLLSLFLYFRKDWMAITKAIFDKNSSEKKLFWFILFATAPGITLGWMGKDVVDKMFYHPLPVAISMGGFAILFYLIEKISRKNKVLNELNFFHAFLIGIIQSLAIIPGISRSGITITGGLLLGLDRENAVRFSFYLALPIILGAVVLEYKEILKGLFSKDFIPNSLGFFSSFLAGLLAIHFLMKFVKNHSFSLFIIYRLFISLLIIGIILI